MLPEPPLGSGDMLPTRASRMEHNLKIEPLFKTGMNARWLSTP
ncbi:hypothetical protein THF1C08_20310 [Vibrio jasicida]|uniref:Uncharacterized protein n=1 Tax=Vibrio jasicida TaxID=766224 RepID=A0AAU9QLH2_9VIBR|nr:hypothetical protein THF1C08_20310 [Vibrio jasicida]CAH1586690.1 hypothetical protein THF1A12_20312 [Vibrio jasicida]